MLRRHGVLNSESPATRRRCCRDRASRLLRMAVAAILLGSCDPLPAAARLGVTVEDDQPVVIYRGCPDERVARVQVLRQRGDSPWDGDDEILWAIAATRAEHETRFEVGDAVKGYAEEQELGAPLPAGEEVVATVETADEVGTALAFEVGELTEDSILSGPDGEARTPEEFEERATEDC